MKIDVIIVGSGIAGSVLARRMAEEKNKQVLVVDKRNYIGGYCYDYRDKNGILIHRVGEGVAVPVAFHRVGGLSAQSIDICKRIFLSNAD